MRTLCQLILLALIPSLMPLSCGVGSAERLITPGAFHTEQYLPLLEGKRTGVVANHTSLVGGVHLVDTLLQRGVEIDRIFSPEHGFRGDADAGAHVEGSIDEATGLRVISLYGSRRRPLQADLEGLDIILFDIQDVGTRFYTYISTLQYVMEVASELEIPVVILDRPNPNGHFVDGPVLDTAYRSFVGMQPIPVVHGMTVGEYAMMLNGEGWLQGGLTCDLSVIRCGGYNHAESRYILPVPPSPNLPDSNSVYLYPSTCFFEGTVFSVGRGTPTPFQLYGHPDYMFKEFSFIPVPGPGAADPRLREQVCYGKDLRDATRSGVVPDTIIHLEWIIDAYRNYPDTAGFFNNYFNTLAGTNRLMNQIRAGLSVAEIRESWQDELSAFREIRKRYLLY